MTPSQQDLQTRLDFAVDAALQASDLILTHFQDANLQVERKADSSPVTVADRETELLIRKRIEEEYPSDGILGEEFESRESKNGYRWILDPIDGTKSFVHGVPLFGTLIALEFEGEMVIGVCRFAGLYETVYAARGLGAWWQVGTEEPRPAKVSSVAKLDDALFCTTTVSGWNRVNAADKFATLCDTAGLTRGWGDCYGHILVATGRAELMVDPQLSIWDAAALIPILEEAGGHFIDWQGNPSAENGNGLSVNAALKDAVLQILGK